ncbi:MAG: hypothetical protein P4L73_03555 [Caulobacteraceae bacterium]|nr:hypothetical protein [Caulobacteraceae bacterium]
MSTPDWPALMSVEKAAAYLDVSEKTFAAMAAMNGVRPVETGFRVLRWRRRDLDQLVDSLPAKGSDPSGGVARQPGMDSAAEGLANVERLAQRRRGGR